MKVFLMLKNSFSDCRLYACNNAAVTQISYDYFENGKAQDVGNCQIKFFYSAASILRDLAEHPHECKVTSTADFEWMCRLKYQYTKKDEAAGTETELSLRTDGSWSVRYGFEYYGKNARLVVTPTAISVSQTFYAMRQWCGGHCKG